jgi:hypothetical protein
MKRLGLLCLLLFIGSWGWGAVVFDTSTASGFGASPITWSITIGNGAAGGNQATVVNCGGDGSVTVTAVTVGGTSCTVAQRFTGDTTLSEASSWVCLGAVDGARTVSVTFSVSNKVTCVANSYKGVAQASTVDISTGSYDKTTGNNTDSVSANTSVSNDMLDSYIYEGNAAATPLGGQTLTSRTNNTNEAQQTAASFKLVGASGSQSMGWTNAFVSNIIIWTALEPASSSGVTPLFSIQGGKVKISGAKVQVQ